jgi:hypothetical protein
MIGGSPMMAGPMMMQGMPMQPLPAAPQPQPWPPRQAMPPMPTPPVSWVPDAPPEMPAPKVRAKIELDAPPEVLTTPPPPVRLPSPEEAGVAAPRLAGTVDWDATRKHLEKLGGVDLQPTALADGRVRVVLVMRTDQANRYHHIEATAATAHEAVNAAMWHAEKWVSGQ